MMAVVANHLWQSTLFVLAAWSLAVALRDRQARVRYAVWLAASLKFLVPFALLVNIGAVFGGTAPAPDPAHSFIPAAVFAMGQTMVREWTPLAAPASAPAADGASSGIIASVWAVGFGALIRARLSTWRKLRRTVKASKLLVLLDVHVPPDVEVRSVSALLEPAVVGFRKPVLLLPHDIKSFVTTRQLQAILLHEVAHIRRRDNVTAAMHMVVEAVFWFHPAVWWIGSRLMRERERACDEHVLRSLGDPATYAEAIVAVCRRCTATSAMSAGVSGSDLHARLSAIAANQVGLRLGTLRRIIVLAAAVCPVAVPFAGGLLGTVTTMSAQAGSPPTAGAETKERPSFEVASVKENRSGERRQYSRMTHDAVIVTNMRLRSLISLAYPIRPDRIVSVPPWFDDARFDISARARDAASTDELRRMLRELLAERFRLVVRHEMRQQNVYALVLARRDRGFGPALMPSTACEPFNPDEPGSRPATTRAGTKSRRLCVTFAGVDDEGLYIEAGARPLQDLVDALEGPTFANLLGRPVVDRTGLTGTYDFLVRFSGPTETAIAAANPRRPPLDTALREQLGLRLEATRAPVEYMVIERAEPPRPD